MAPRRSLISDEVLSHIHTNGVDVKDRIIYTSSHFDADEWALDFKQAIVFLKNLDYLNSLSSEPITIKMFSPGGCYHAGMMMYDAILNSAAPTILYSYGIAASMGSVIPQAATERYISKHTAFMVHRLSYDDGGDILKMRSGVDFAEKQMDDLLEVYIKRCVTGKFFKSQKMNTESVKKFLSDILEKKVDWWLTAEEAVYYGFMDGVI